MAKYSSGKGNLAEKIRQALWNSKKKKKKEERNKHLVVTYGEHIS